jgi:23S rRNA pseudouridine955/2504/2580 synthase
VRVNSKRVEVSDRLAVGDRMRVPPVRVSAPATPPPMWIAPANFPVLFEDETLLAINKPSGVAVHGGSGISFGVIEQLRAARPESTFLELVHRLDRDTSGILLLAKKRVALVGMHALLRDGHVDKRYLALVRGRWPHLRREVRVSLHKYVDASGERRVRVDPDGQDAVTIFTRSKVWRDDATLVEARLKTGRTHQIRVHLAHLGFPIAGDDKYGDFEWNRVLAKEGLKRMFLHAAKLGFTHPVTHVAVRLEAALPLELTRYIDRLDGGVADAAGKA